MKKLTIMLAVLATTMFFVGTAFAGNYFINFGTGAAKGAGGGIYHVVMAPVNFFGELFEGDVVEAFSDLGDSTRGPVKLVEEIGYGVTGQATDLPIEDIGGWNGVIEDNVVAHTIRNGAGTFAATAGLLGPHHRWSLVWQVAACAGTATGAGTALAHYRDER